MNKPLRMTLVTPKAIKVACPECGEDLLTFEAWAMKLGKELDEYKRNTRDEMKRKPLVEDAMHSHAWWLEFIAWLLNTDRADYEDIVALAAMIVMKGSPRKGPGDPHPAKKPPTH